MKCPNCGRLDFDNSEICPRCGEPLPPGSGEHSSTSGEKVKSVQPPDENSKESLPLFSQSKKVDTTTPQEKTDSHEKKRAKEPTPPPTEKKTVASASRKKELTPPPAVEKKREEIPPPPPPATGHTIPKITRTAETKDSRSSWSGSSGSDFYKRTSASPRSVYIEKGKFTTPEPYIKDSATFSSELSTDWIEKYARSHVVKTSNTAGIGMRIWAFFIDWLLLTAMGVVLLLAGRLILMVVNGGGISPAEQLKVLLIPTTALWLVLVFLYLTIFTAVSGQTPGMSAMDLRVATQDGRNPDFKKSALRSAVYLVGLIPLGAGHWWALLNEEKRALHDITAGTMVLSVIQKPIRTDKL